LATKAALVGPQFRYYWHRGFTRKGGKRFLLMPMAFEDVYPWLIRDLPNHPPNLMPRILGLSEIDPDPYRAMSSIRSAPEIQVDIVIIDTNRDKTSFAATGISDLILCPTNGHPIESDYLENFEVFLRLQRTEVRVLLSRIMDPAYGLAVEYFSSEADVANAKVQLEKGKEFIEGTLGMHLCPWSLRDGVSWTPLQIFHDDWWGKNTPNPVA
jgi:hypothetical protein